MALNLASLETNFQCQIIWIPWLADFQGAPIAPMASSSFDISNHLVSNCTFSKNLSAASGVFSFVLDNSRPWNEIIKPGHWCLIYMSSNGSLALPQDDSNIPTSPSNVVSTPSNINLSSLQKNQSLLRAVCYVERVSYTGNLNVDGALDITYEISGRDWGIIYDETQLWYNTWIYEQTRIQSLETHIKLTGQQKLNDQLQFIHDLFLAASKVITNNSPLIGPGGSLTELGQQWILPSDLVNILQLTFSGTNSNYMGYLNNYFQFQQSSLVMNVMPILNYINGTAWSKLKETSFPVVNELFYELSSLGEPKLTFRGIPWSIKPKNYPLLVSDSSAPRLFLDIINNGVQLKDDSTILQYNFGLDDHSRYNHFLLGYSSDQIGLTSSITTLKNIMSPGGRYFPYFDGNSIHKYGYRPMHSEFDSLSTFLLKNFSGATPDAGKVTSDLFVQFNELFYDYWVNAINFESGNLTILGNNQIRIGLGLYFDPSIKILGNKGFYIEGYTDTFTIDENGTTDWVQNIVLTRGVDKDFLSSLTSVPSSTTQTKPFTGEYTGKM